MGTVCPTRSCYNWGLIQETKMGKTLQANVLKKTGYKALADELETVG